MTAGLRRGTFAILALGAVGCLALAWTPSVPRLMWNVTASVPVGLYGLSKPKAITRGDLVAITPEPGLAHRLARQGLLPLGVPLLKPVAAVGGQTVCRRGALVTIDGGVAARAHERDGRGQPLPRWSGCTRLIGGEVFVLSPASGSFDGRYFGITPSGAITAKARAVWIPRCVGDSP